MASDAVFLAIFHGLPIVLFWSLVLLLRKAGLALSAVSVVVILYVVWINVTDASARGQLDLGPAIRSAMALAALAGPLMALACHLIGERARTWRWRLFSLVAGFPVAFGLVELYDLF